MAAGDESIYGHEFFDIECGHERFDVRRAFDFDPVLCDRFDQPYHTGAPFVIVFS